MRKTLQNALLVFSSSMGVLLLVWLADMAVGRCSPPIVRFDFGFAPGVYATKCLDFEYTAVINSMGLREREISPVKRTKYRILAIGDSTTYGWGVDAEDTWLRILERDLRAAGLEVETINMGKPGADPAWYAQAACAAVPALRPDLVLVTLFQGDDVMQSSSPAEKSVQHGTIQWVRRAFPNLTRLFAEGLRPGPIDSIPPAHQTVENNRSNWAGAADNFYKQYFPPEQKERLNGLDAAVREAFFEGTINPFQVALATGNPDYFLMPLNLHDGGIMNNIDAIAAHLARIKECCTAQKAKLVALISPLGMYVNESSWRNMPRTGFRCTPESLTSDAPDEAIEMACARAGISCCTVTAGFRAQIAAADLFYTFDYHMTAKGNALFAELVEPCVRTAIAELR